MDFTKEQANQMIEAATQVREGFPKFFTTDGGKFGNYSWEEGCDLINATLDALRPMMPMQRKVGGHSFRGEWFIMESQVNQAIFAIDMLTAPLKKDANATIS